MSIPYPESVSETEIADRLREGTVLEASRHGWKVFEDTDGFIWKRLRQDGYFSSSLVMPYAVQFARNAQKLANLGFTTVQVERIGRIQGTRDYLVRYAKLSGEALRHLLEARTAPANWAHVLARLMAELHEKGVSFRGLHMGNILVTPTGELALLDVADIRFHRLPLNWRARKRNFAPLLRYPGDRRALYASGFQNFLEHYLHHGSLSRRKKERLRHVMHTEYGA